MPKITSTMKKSPLMWAVLFAVLLLGPVDSQADIQQDIHRADIASIALPVSSGTRDMPPVQFLHDRHTTALKDKDKDCSTCHPRQNDRLIFSFKTKDPLSYKAAKALYHKNCIGCHEETAAKGEKAGPQAGECRLCHARNPKYVSVWRSISLDRSLHYRHESDPLIPAEIVGGEKINCGACHHQYDEAAKKTVYMKGEEGSCRYCHLHEVTARKGIEKVRDIRSASHDACVNCHKTMSAAAAGKDVKVGPTRCGGCHEAAEQSQIKVIQNVPRMKRNQPDAVLLTQATDKEPPLTEDWINQLIEPVAFDHKGHEAGVSSCRTCHHASLEKCSRCHTQTGDEKGGFIRLEQAMHAQAEKQSCVGCHNQAQTQKQCAGCHLQLPPKPFGELQCTQCHALKKLTFASLPIDKKTAAQLAVNAIANRSVPVKELPIEQIKEKVTIDSMVDQYEAVELPHRKIIQTLMGAIKDNKMAAVFHAEPTTLCRGCHHKSPASTNPPKCATCHGKPFQKIADDRPGLKASFHVQCMGCHQRMEIKKPASTDCEACHKKRKKNPASSR